MVFRPQSMVALLAALALAAPCHAASRPALPQTVPVPEIHNPPAGNIAPEKLGDTPVPEPKPDEAPPEKTPLLEQSPEKPDETSETPKDEKPAMLPDARSGAKTPAAMPAEETTCRQRLTTLGVAFSERPPLSDPIGCAMPYPLAVTSLGSQIALEPKAVMNCAMAEASARFMADIVSPAAKTAYGEELKGVAQASAYVCRPRNGTHKLSEHAFGNALDIARFTLSKGTAIDVEPAPDAKAAKFLADIRKAACGPFKTVLGPGSDADHALHFHFDLAPRRNGGIFCQ